MMTSSNVNIFRVTDLFVRGIYRSRGALMFFLYAPEQTAEETAEMLVI